MKDDIDLSRCQYVYVIELRLAPGLFKPVSAIGLVPEEARQRLLNFYHRNPGQIYRATRYVRASDVGLHSNCIDIP